MLFVARSFTLAFIKIEQIALNTFSFYFDRTKEDFEFLPGQYIRMTFSIPGVDNRGISRFFTIASSPLQKKYLAITIKIGQSDFKHALFALRPKDEVTFFGPIGGFYFDETDASERVFLAGGIGITPFHSMITYAAKKKLHIPITLIASFSSQEEVVYEKELLQIAKKHTQIKIIYSITRLEKSQTTWSGETERISEALINKYVVDITKPTYFIVGSPHMVDATEELLEKMGVSLEKIKIEQFTGY